VHYGVTRLPGIHVPADKPIVTLQEAYTRIPLLGGQPRHWKSRLIAVSAPIFWLLFASPLSVVLSIKAWSLGGSYHWLLQILIASPFLYLSIGSIAMVLLHIDYFRTLNSDLYRFFYSFTDPKEVSEQFPTRPDPFMQPISELKSRADRLYQMQDVLRITFSSLDVSLFEKFHSLPLVIPSEGDIHIFSPREYYKYVVSMGVETDLKQFFMTLEVEQVPEHFRGNFKRIKEELRLEVNQEKEWTLVLAALEDANLDNDERAIIGLNLKKIRSAKEFKFAFLVNNLSKETWSGIEVQEAALMVIPTDSLRQGVRFIHIGKKHHGFFSNVVKFIFEEFRPPYMPPTRRRRRPSLLDALDKQRNSRAERAFNTSV